MDAAQSHEPVMQVPALEEPDEEFLDSRRKGAVSIAEPVVPHAAELLHGVLDDLLELIRGRARLVARCGGQRRRHETSGPWPEQGNGGEAGRPGRQGGFSIAGGSYRGEKNLWKESLPR